MLGEQNPGIKKKGADSSGSEGPSDSDAGLTPVKEDRARRAYIEMWLSEVLGQFQQTLKVLWVKNK